MTIRIFINSFNYQNHFNSISKNNQSIFSLSSRDRSCILNQVMPFVVLVGIKFLSHSERALIKLINTCHLAFPQLACWNDAEAGLIVRIRVI